MGIVKQKKTSQTFELATIEFDSVTIFYLIIINIIFSHTGLIYALVETTLE